MQNMILIHITKVTQCLGLYLFTFIYALLLVTEIDYYAYISNYISVFLCMLNDHLMNKTIQLVSSINVSTTVMHS